MSDVNTSRESDGTKADPCDIQSNQKDENPNSNEIPHTESDDKLNDYQKYITYDADGTAVYTDPSNSHQFVFDKEENRWVSKSTSNAESANSDPYENEHYRWCAQTNQWILKNPAGSTTNSIENEYYKWNTEKNEWEPKNIDQRFATSVYKDGQHLYTDSDGTIFFWDEEKKAWFPKIDDDFMAIYQTNYGFIDNTTVETIKQDSPEIDKNVTDSQKDTVNEDEIQSTPGKRKANQPQWFEESPENCTKVYVSNLPEDITEDEFIEVMSKCGMILRDPHTKKMKVKLYAEPDGQLKGDGLVSYIRTESVKLAIDLLDGYDVRGRTIKVQRAQFQMRGEYNPALKPKKKKKDKEKEKKLKEKLLDWRPDKLRGEREKHERVVILKNLFTLDTFENHVDLIIDYQNNLRAECSKCGTVKKVVIYSSEPEGVAEIRMNDPDEADLVVQMMHRRYFGTRTITAELWDGKTRYRRNETETETSERLTKWEEFLESDDNKQPTEK